MGFNIDRFKSNINSYGYLKPNLFEVFVQAPNFMIPSALNNNNNLSSTAEINNVLRYRIDQVKIPGVSLLSGDVNVYGVGPTQKMPYNAYFYDTTFTVLLDKNATLYNFWYEWTRYIKEFNGTETSADVFTPGARIPSFNTRYKDDYSSMMSINMYDEEGNLAQKVNLYEAFPSSIRELPLAWNDTQDLVRISVSITYSNYSIENLSLRQNFEDLLPPTP